MTIEQLGTSKPTVSEMMLEKQYKIPKYQRAFSWNQDKAEQLYVDIFSSRDNYFLGSILLNKREGYFEVIDGQQRLTTLSILILSIFLIYKTNVDEVEAQKYIHKYLKFGNTRGEYATLVLSRHNNNFYNELVDLTSFEEVDSLVPSENDKAMLAVLKLFIKKINEKKVTDIHLEKARLNDILEKVTEKVFFLQLTVTDYAQASKLFEVLNNRGTELSEADLVRNHLLSELERQGLGTEENIKLWEQIEDKIGLSNLERFIRYASFSFSNEQDIYSRVQNFINIKSSKTTLDELDVMSKLYASFVDPELFEDQDEANIHTEMNAIGATQVRSVLLAGYLKYEKSDIQTLLNFLVSFSLRFIVSDKNPNKLEKKYAELAYSIYNEGLEVTDVINILKANDICPTADEFSLSFSNKSFKSNTLPRYILSKIEDHISTEEKYTNLNGVDLEHIMPKKIDKWQAVKDYTEVHKNYLNNIGNMVILSSKINSRIKNDLFEQKKNHYDDSEINLIADIKSKDKWEEEEIVENTKRYLSRALEIWTV